jgi:murein L,D-transpeptidase YcbB/YkuD
MPWRSPCSSGCMRQGRTSGVLAAAIATLGIACAADRTAEVTSAIQEVVAAASAEQGAAVQTDVAGFYAMRANAPVWVTKNASADPEAALAVIRSAPNHGLAAADYGESDLAPLIDAEDDVEDQLKNDPQALARFDVALTAGLLALGKDVALGRGDPKDVSSLWKKRREAPDFLATLTEAVGDTGNLGNWLDRVRPRHPEYAALQQVLTGINEKQKAAGTADARVGQIALNMERWRWLPDDLGARHVLVNVPAFYMAARENGKPVLEMKVIVGKPENATPIFSDVMETVVFSPYWNVPDSIAEGETAPAAARDPGFLARQNIEILRRTGGGTELVDPSSVDWDDPASIKELAFRQKPGATNALGHVKFLFPNPHDVYLHDTPADSLFSRQGRELSHGCVRLEMPEDLARYLLRDQPQWDDDRIRKAMYAGEEKHVALKEKLPVHLVYFTVWPRGDRNVEMFDDIYRYDSKQLVARRTASQQQLSRR